MPRFQFEVIGIVAEILTVGTEILLGNITNSNAAFLSRQLAGIGVAVFRHTSVGDNHERLERAISVAFENADIVITTGGLGPTQDDITKTVAADFFGLPLEMHEESRQRILARFAGRDLPECVERNALVPAGATVFPNENGSAPGVCIERRNSPSPQRGEGEGSAPFAGGGYATPAEEAVLFAGGNNAAPAGRAALFTGENCATPAEGVALLAGENYAAPAGGLDAFCGKILIMLPGPPHEMQPMFLEHGLAFLRKKTERVFVSRTLKITGMGETAVESALRDLIDAQTNPTIAPYAKLAEVHIRLTAAAPDEPTAHALLAPVADEIYSRIGTHIYAEGEVSLAEVVLTLLREGGHSLAVAESCTGGLIAAEIVSVPGSSDVFREGFVTYSNEAKITRLSVPAEILEAHGAVSEETAAAMATGAAAASGATVAISVTGIAGPGGGTPEKPTGLVYVGLSIAGRTFTAKLNLIGSRNEVRKRATVHALDFLRKNFA